MREVLLMCLVSETDELEGFLEDGRVELTHEIRIPRDDALSQEVDRIITQRLGGAKKSPPDDVAELLDFTMARDGGLVVVAEKSCGRVALGRLQGEYDFPTRQKVRNAVVHTRAVRWLLESTIEDLSIGARRVVERSQKRAARLRSSSAKALVSSLDPALLEE